MPKFKDLCAWLTCTHNSDPPNVDIESGPILTDNDDLDTITVAPAHNDRSSDLTCGFGLLPSSQRTCIGTMKYFLVFVCMCITSQATAQIYFNRTATIWKQQYGFSEEITDWLIIGNALFHGIFTIFIVHASIKYHRMIWISSSLVLFSLSCFALLIPEYMQPLTFEEDHTIKQHYDNQQLCLFTGNSTSDIIETTTPSCWYCYLLMMVFQCTLGASTALFLVHVTVFIDDHEDMDNAIIFYGVLLAFKQLGPYIGNALAWLTVLTQSTNIFGSPAWITLSTIIFIIGMILGMFPHFLSQNIKTKSIVCSEDAINNGKNLSSILGRILLNKVVLLNITTSVCFWAGVTNFALMDNKISKAKFAFPDEDLFEKPMIFQVVITILKPWLVFVTILCTALMISKLNLRAFALSMWNGIAPAILVCVFMMYIILGCKVPSFGEMEFVENNCSCGCDATLYEPVCVPELQKTFFSPCYAGCTGTDDEEGLAIFTNCTCTSPLHMPFKGYPGLCGMSSCYPEWMSQDLVQVLVAAIAGSVLVCHIIVTIYSVHFSERCYALAVQIASLGLVEFGPIRSAYFVVADHACHYFNTAGICRLHDPVNLTRYLLSLTIVFLLFSSLGGMLMAVAIRGQTSRSPDFVTGVPQRPRRRYQEQAEAANHDESMELGGVQLQSVQNRDREQLVESTSLVFVEMHRVNTMDTIQEVPEEVDSSVEETSEEEDHEVEELGVERIEIRTGTDGLPTAKFESGRTEMTEAEMHEIELEEMEPQNVDDTYYDENEYDENTPFFKETSF